MKGWGGGSVIKCMYCSCKRPKFCYQHPCMSAHSQLPVTPVLENRMPSSSLCEHLHTSTHIYIILKKKKTQKDAGWIFVVDFWSRSKFRVRIVLFWDGVYISYFSVAVIKCVFYHAKATYRRKCSFGLPFQRDRVRHAGRGGEHDSKQQTWWVEQKLRSQISSHGKLESKLPRNGSSL